MNENSESVLPKEDEPTKAETTVKEPPKTQSVPAVEESSADDGELKLLNEKMDTFIKQEYEEELKNQEFQKKLIETVEKLIPSEGSGQPLESEQLLATIAENTKPFEMELESQTAAYYANLSIIVVLGGLTGIVIAWKLISWIFNSLLRYVG